MVGAGVLLRSLSSSPAAAAVTLRNRSSSSEGDTVEQIEEESRRAVLDLDGAKPVVHVWALQ